MSNRINLSPLHWGPKTWFFLESAAIAYPTNPTDAEKTSAKNLLLSLKDLLPCLSCRINYASYLDENINYLDDAVKDRDSLFEFILKVHNDVRVKTGKAGRSIEEVFNYYQTQYSKVAESTTQVDTEDFTNLKIKSKEEIMKSMEYNTNIKESFASEMLFHFNPITLLIGFMVGLIAYKFYTEYNTTNTTNPT
jgi:hypothetical protein